LGENIRVTRGGPPKPVVPVRIWGGLMEPHSGGKKNGTQKYPPKRGPNPKGPQFPLKRKRRMAKQKGKPKEGLAISENYPLTIPL